MSKTKIIGTQTTSKQLSVTHPQKWVKSHVEY